MKPLTVLCSSF